MPDQYDIKPANCTCPYPGLWPVIQVGTRQAVQFMNVIGAKLKGVKQ